MDGTKLTGARCPHCGGVEVAGLMVHQNAEVNQVGLAYKTAKIFITVEQLYADLCLNCGTVVRFFVKETNRKWVQKEQ
jgi:hypothetical protein